MSVLSPLAHVAIEHGSLNDALRLAATDPYVDEAPTARAPQAPRTVLRSIVRNLAVRMLRFSEASS